ncbi:MAG: hypothetical protein K2I81_00485 [Alphaproteobacteria bacterium]|nr:hypothetical protein [Alphaproteobacteria bacterium]
MKIYNGIQFIKSGIRRIFNKSHIGSNADQDLNLLSAMCVETHILTASNGGKYWYYFPNTMENVDVAQYLLERNGVVPTFRMSRYMAGFSRRRPAFRLSQSYLLRHPEINEFVKKIKERDYRMVNDANLELQILNIRNQMRQK